MRSKEISINDIISYMQGQEQHPIMHVKDENDPDYKSMRKFVMDIWPDTEDYMSSVTSKMNMLMSSLRYMEPNDYAKVVGTFKKYQVEGKSNGIRGLKTYGYDKSRVDNRMIRRKRGN
jgi:hypothetical protein